MASLQNKECDEGLRVTQLFRTQVWGRPAKGLLIAAVLLAGTMGVVLVPSQFWAADSTQALPQVLAFSSQDAYQEGVKAYRRGEFNEALVLLRHAEARDPNNPNVRYYMAICLDKLVRYNEAVLQYQYVSQHGEDPQVVDFSRYRLKTLKDRLGPPEMVATASGQPIASINGATRNSFPEKTAGEKISVVPLKQSSQALLVEATLTSSGSSSSGSQASTGTFILDTGATYTSISREMAEEMGLDLENAPKVRITTANGRIEVPKVVIDRLSVNGLEARDVEATVIEIRKGSSFSGLLGLSFIRKFKLTIDPEAGQLIFHQN